MRCILFVGDRDRRDDEAETSDARYFSWEVGNVAGYEQ